MIGALRLVPALAAAVAVGALVVDAGGGGTFIPLANPADTAGIGTGTGTAIEVADAMAGALLLAFAAAG